MVRVDQNTTDRIVAWRVRDALAAHPLLGGHMAQITVVASYEGVVLDGWAQDEDVLRLAVKLARRAAGARSIQANLQMRCRRSSALEHC
jgi:osmotically-inducible protein OsmY